MRRALGPLSLVAALLALVFLGQSLLGSWSDLRPRLASFDPVPFAVGVGLMMLQTALVAAIWRDLIALQGWRVGLGRSYHMIFIAALGKYLPGKVWALGGIAVMAQRAGIPIRAATVASTATVALVAAGGAMVGGLAYLLWRLAVAPPIVLASAAALALAPLAIALALARRSPGLAGRPAAVPGAEARLSRAGVGAPPPAAARRAGIPEAGAGSARSGVAAPPAPDAGRSAGMLAALRHPGLAAARIGPDRASLGLRAVAAANASWLLLGLANLSIAAAIDRIGLDLAPPLLASAALGWAAGLAAVAIPAGIGVREAVQALALGDVLPPATAATVALLVRLALILGDLLAAALAWALRPGAGALETRAPLPDH